jgi:hypothetical protein
VRGHNLGEWGLSSGASGSSEYSELGTNLGLLSHSDTPITEFLPGAAGNVRIQTAYALQTLYLSARIEGQAFTRLPRRCGFSFQIPDSKNGGHPRLRKFPR